MTNIVSNVTFQVPLVPENAEKIDQINRIILGESYTKAAPAKAYTETDSSAPAKTASTKTASADVDLEDVKRAAKRAKNKHGEEFANEVLDGFNVKEGASLGRRMSAIDEDIYAEVIEAWDNGPQEVTQQASDEDDGFGDEDDGFGDEDDGITAEAVKTALKAYAKDVGREEAKAIMTKNGAKALSDVDNCSAAQLSAMFKALV